MIKQNSNNFKHSRYDKDKDSKVTWFKKAIAVKGILATPREADAVFDEMKKSPEWDGGKLEIAKHNCFDFVYQFVRKLAVRQGKPCPKKENWPEPLRMMDRRYSFKHNHPSIFKE